MFLAALLLATQAPADRTDGCPGTWTFFAEDSVQLDSSALYNIEWLLVWARPMVDAGGWLNLDAGAVDADSAAQNLALSRRRAEAVQRYLVARGIDRDRLRIHAYGDTRPFAMPDSSTPPDQIRAQNRYVQVWPEMPLSVFHRFFPPGGAIC
jgi:hypothetical protein